MIWSLIAQLVTLFFDIFVTQRRTNQDKDIEILLLRQQLRILLRKSPVTKVTPLQKLILAVVLMKFKRITRQTNQPLRSVILIVRPETVLRWHRQLVRRKWTQIQAPRGRKPIPVSLENLIVQLAGENSSRASRRISGELQKRGYRVGKTTIAHLLKRHGLAPAVRAT